MPQDFGSCHRCRNHGSSSRRDAYKSIITVTRSYDIIVSIFIHLEHQFWDTAEFCTNSTHVLPVHGTHYGTAQGLDRHGAIDKGQSQLVSQEKSNHRWIACWMVQTENLGWSWNNGTQLRNRRQQLLFHGTLGLQIAFQPVGRQIFLNEGAAGHIGPTGFGGRCEAKGEFLHIHLSHVAT